MIQAKTPIANKPKGSAENSREFFVISKNIIPLKRYTHDSIRGIEEEITEKVLPRSQVEKLVTRYKDSNIVSKFINRVDVYLDNLQKFLRDIKNLFRISIVQKKILLFSEKSSQSINTYQAKRIVRETKKNQEKSQKPSVNLTEDTNVISLLAAAFGLKAVQSMQPSIGISEVYGDVAKKGEFAITDQSKVAPDWIPFPKGTSGLVFTSGYGNRTHPITGSVKFHAGIDIAGPSGLPVITPISGVVSSAGNDGDGYGYKVVVTSGQVSMLFGHLLRDLRVKRGQQVKAGTVVGLMGSTGLSTGPHLHWEVKINGSNVDPSQWTKTNRPGTSTAGATTNLKAKISEPDKHPSTSKQSDGGFDVSRRIMIGEAGTEFRIPLSQMPLFIQAMMEEKIKTLIPSYQVSRGFPTNEKTHSGSAQSKFASGVIIDYRNNNYSFTAKKIKSMFPSAKNYHIAAAMGNFETEAPGLKPNTYQVGGGPGRGIAQWETPGRWDTAVKKYGSGIINSLGQQLDFFKWEMDTAHEINGTPNLPWGKAAKREWLQSNNLVKATENFMLGYEAPGIPHWNKRLAAAVSFNRNMDKLLGKPSTTKPSTKKREPNIFEKFINFVTPVKRASLNEIDGANQMEVSKTYSKQFDFENMTNEIVALYKPTVYYSET